jgi:hypothetical protein
VVLLPRNDSLEQFSTGQNFHHNAKVALGVNHWRKNFFGACQNFCEKWSWRKGSHQMKEIQNNKNSK